MRVFAQIFIVAFSIALFSGCKRNDASLNATRLRVKLTDAPSDPLIVKELNIDIRKIEISTTTTDGKTENWKELDFKGGIYNMLTLTNGKSKQIVDQYFPAGVLRRMKIIFGTNSNIVTTSDKKIDLSLAPEIKDSVVVSLNANMYAHYITTITIDINGLLSIRESAGNYYLYPVLRVFDEVSTGSLKGYALPLEAEPRVIISTDNDTLRTIPETSDGMFLFKGLKAGKWKVSVLAKPKSGYVDTVFTDSVFVPRTTELKSKIILKKRGTVLISK